MAKAEFFDNAAGRLHSILVELRARVGGEKIIDAWAVVLKVERRSSLLLQEIAAVIELPERIREQLTRISPEDAEDMLEHIPNIEEALKYSFYQENPISELNAKYSDADLVGLWYCSRELHRLAPEPTLSQDQHQQLTDQLHELLGDPTGGRGRPDGKRTRRAPLRPGLRWRPGRIPTSRRG